jgi:hypothetical protein
VRKIGGPCSEGLLAWGGLEHNVMMRSGLVELDGGIDGSELGLRFLQVLNDSVHSGSWSSDLASHICNSANHPLAVMILLQECEDVRPCVLSEALAVCHYICTGHLR